LAPECIGTSVSDMATMSAVYGDILILKVGHSETSYFPLESQKEPVEILVIDFVEKPSESFLFAG